MESPAVHAAPAEAVIFDLDGTLVQTRVASWAIFSRINDRFALGVDGPEQYFDLFQGNVYASIAKLCRDDDHAAEVKAAFLELLRNEYDPPLVPGLGDVVRRLAEHCTLAVMSSNAMRVMRRVLAGNDLAFCFAHVFGGDVIADKRTAMRQFLADTGNRFGRRCAADYDEGGARHAPDLASTVLVTDTAGDVRDAVEVGIRAVGVAWGMHPVDELVAAGAEFVALWPQELTSHLLGDGAARPPSGACAVRRPPAGATGPGGAGGCGCGCDGGAAPPAGVGEIRRQRRRAAATALRSGGPTGSSTSDAPRPERSTSDRGAGGAAPAARPSSNGSAGELLTALRRMAD